MHTYVGKQYSLLIQEAPFKYFRNLPVVYTHTHTDIHTLHIARQGARVICQDT